MKTASQFTVSNSYSGIRVNHIIVAFFLFIFLFSSCSDKKTDYHACVPEFISFAEKVEKEYKDYTTKQWDEANADFKNHLVRMQAFNDEFTYRDKKKIAELSKTYVKVQLAQRSGEDLQKILDILNK